MFRALVVGMSRWRFVLSFALCDHGTDVNLAARIGLYLNLVILWPLQRRKARKNRLGDFASLSHLERGVLSLLSCHLFTTYSECWLCYHVVTAALCCFLRQVSMLFLVFSLVTCIKVLMLVGVADSTGPYLLLLSGSAGLVSRVTSHADGRDCRRRSGFFFLCKLRGHGSRNECTVNAFLFVQNTLGDIDDQK